MKKQTIVIVLPFIAGIAAFFAIAGNKNAGAELSAFAECLRDKGAVMYGAEWCPHCQNEKKVFGNSFSRIPYVECPENPNQCLAAGIQGYPTWIFPDGKRLEGEQGLKKLSEESGCPLPNPNN